MEDLFLCYWSQGPAAHSVQCMRVLVYTHSNLTAFALVSFLFCFKLNATKKAISGENTDA